jgi:hypothetical protein
MPPAHDAGKMMTSVRIRETEAISNSLPLLKNKSYSFARNQDSSQKIARLIVRSSDPGKKENEYMTRNRLCQFFALTLLLAVALPVMAARKNTKEASGNIVAKGTFTLDSGKSLSGTKLRSGEYKVLASDSRVSFLLDGKIVAQASIQWKDGDPVNTNTVIDESGNIRELRFKGKKRSAVIM